MKQKSYTQYQILFQLLYIASLDFSFSSLVFFFQSHNSLRESHFSKSNISFKHKLILLSSYFTVVCDSVWFSVFSVHKRISHMEIKLLLDSMGIQTKAEKWQGCGMQNVFKLSFPLLTSFKRKKVHCFTYIQFNQKYLKTNISSNLWFTTYPTYFTSTCRIEDTAT